MTHIR